MQDIGVLWLDDDSPIANKKALSKIEEQVPGITLFTATSCEKSESLLRSMTKPPMWAIVDLIVPQGKWGDKYYRIPGIKYIEHLKANYGDNINIYAFSIMVNRAIEQKVKAAGASEAFVKSNISFVGVLEKIVEASRTKK